MKHHALAIFRFSPVSASQLPGFSRRLSWPLTAWLFASLSIAASAQTTLLGVPLGPDTSTRPTNSSVAASSGSAKTAASPDAVAKTTVAAPAEGSLGGPSQPNTGATASADDKGHGGVNEAITEMLPVDLAAITRLKVAGQDIAEAPLRMGNLDVLAPIGPALEKMGVLITHVAPEYLPGGANGPDNNTYFQLNLSNGSAPIVLTVGKRVAYINKVEQPLRAAPLVIKDKIWLPVFSIAPLLGAAPRLAPNGTLHLNPTIQSVELFTVKGVLALTIKTSAPLPKAGQEGAPQVGTIENPAKIYIDFPGYSLGLDAANSITERVVTSGSGGVARVRAGLFQKFPDTARIVLDLKDDLKSSVQTLPDRSMFALVLLDPTGASADPPPLPNLNASLGGLTIVVDAGHGGKDSGAPGKQSVEKNHTLDIAKRLRDELEKRGATALMTRDGDYFVTLQGRCDFANSRQADLFISCHIDSAPTATATGTTTYYTSAQSQAFAREVQNELAKATGLRSKGIIQRRLWVTRRTFMPSVLTESCYISNPREEKLLLDPNFRQRLANAMAQGISNYLARYGKPKQ